MISMQITTSDRTHLVQYKHGEEIKSFRVAADVLPKYTLAFGYDRDTALEKIKQLVADIKSGDFTASSKDFGQPNVIAKANQAYYAQLKGCKLSLFLKTDTCYAYHAVGFSPKVTHRIEVDTCWRQEDSNIWQRAEIDAAGAKAYRDDWFAMIKRNGHGIPGHQGQVSWTEQELIKIRANIDRADYRRWTTAYKVVDDGYEHGEYLISEPALGLSPAPKVPRYDDEIVYS